jgi:hypothetical protein
MMIKIRIKAGIVDTRIVILNIVEFGLNAC